MGTNPRTLAVDIGGTGIKTLILDAAGKPLTERVRADTPRPATPHAVIAVVQELARQQGDFDRVSVGFPGVVRKGVTETAWRSKTYEEELGLKAFEKAGKAKWNRRLLKAIRRLQLLLNYDTLYIGGGNTKKIAVDLPARVKVVPNVAGLLGGIALWNGKGESESYGIR